MTPYLLDTPAVVSFSGGLTYNADLPRRRVTDMPTRLPVTEWPSLRSHLSRVMAERGVTVGQLAKLTGLQRTTITSALTVSADAQWGTVVKLLAALDLDLSWAQGLAKTKKRAAKVR